MKAFISYSHKDSDMLAVLHKHLTQLQRDGLIQTWTDHEIPAGGKFDVQIDSTLEQSELFIALLSPDYIASNYCFDKEFKKALQMQEQGKLIVVPVILEPCDWLSTPFKQFKALPNDGKPISTWQNINTAFLDVIQNIRSLVRPQSDEIAPSVKTSSQPLSVSRNYRVQKDFDTIERLEFLEESFRNIKEHIKRYREEIIQIENIKARISKDTDYHFECLLVNRNKINTESLLSISIQTPEAQSLFFGNDAKAIHYSIGQTNRAATKSFQLDNDQYHLFWVERSYGTSGKKEFSVKEISDAIWGQWLESVGIL
jgi:hypothetical protein